MGMVRDRAKALIEDMKYSNPEKYEVLKKKGSPVDIAEEFLWRGKRKKDEYFKTMVKQLPKTLNPWEVFQETNRITMVTEEMANEEIMSWLR